MATPKYAERVAVLETKFDVLKEAVEVGFHDLSEKLDAASLNGETPRVKNISRQLGDPISVGILAELVEAHKRRMWLIQPFGKASSGFFNAVLWFASAAAVGSLNAWVHSVVPWIP